MFHYGGFLGDFYVVMINVYVQVITNFFLKNIYLSIYFAALDLTCGMRAWLPHGLWDLHFTARDRTHVPCIGRWTLNHTTRGVPNIRTALKDLQYRTLLKSPIIAKMGNI